MGRVQQRIERAKEQLAHIGEQLRGRPRLGRWIAEGERFVEDAIEDRITGLAAEIAYYATLSLFPAILALAAALGFIGSVVGDAAAERAQVAIVDTIGRALGPGAGSVGTAVEDLFARPSPGLLGLGLLFTLYTTSRGFNALIRALDVVYDIEESRPAFRTRLLGLGLAAGSVLVAALVLTMLIVGPLFGSGRAVADALGLGQLFVTWWTWMRVPVVLIALGGWASVMFHVGPNHSTPWRADLPGALVTTVLWLLGAGGFRIYLQLASDGSNAVFGVLGGVLTLLLWLYVMGLALLIGGEVNAHILQSPGKADQAPPNLAQ